MDDESTMRKSLRSLYRVPTSTIVAFFLLIVIAFFAISATGFWTATNASTILAASSILMLVSLGQLVVVISGGFDLSISGLVPLTAVVFAMMTSHGTPLILAFAVCLFLGALIGVVHTLFIVLLKINPLITTLATLSITGGLAYTISDGQTISLPLRDGFLGNNMFGTVPWNVLFIILLVIVLQIVLRNTIFGRRLYMVGGNQEAARLAGVRVAFVGGSVYVISGIFSAFAGVILASQLLSASGNLASTLTLESLTAVVIGGAALTGGRGSVAGAVSGVLLLGVIANGMAILHIASFYQQIITGFILLLAVILSRVQEKRSVGSPYSTTRVTVKSRSAEA